VTEDLVVDASVLVAALAGEAGLGDAARARLAGRRLHLPHLADLEAVSALRDGVRRGSFEAADALTVIEGLQRFPAARYPHVPFLERAWSLRHNLTVYDASYVALAESLDAPLVTLDAAMASAPGPQCDIEVLR